MSHVMSVSAGLTVEALTPRRTHRIGYGENLASIGRQYGVSPVAIRASNPQIINPNHLYPGEILIIPARVVQTERPSEGPTFPLGDDAPTVKVTSEDKSPPTEDGRTKTQSTTTTSVSVSGDGVTVGRGNSTSTETTTGDADNEITRMRNQAINGSINVNPNEGTVTAAGGVGFTESIKRASGYGISFGLSSDAKIIGGTTTEDGRTTYLASADVSVTVKGGVSAPRASFDASGTTGVKASFSVSMPEAAARNASLESVNPFDPHSMPEGTVIKLDGSHYSRTDFKATFRNIAVQSRVTHENGVSIAVEKTGDTTVRVTAGPTEAISAYRGIGLDFSKVSVMLGGNKKVSNATLTTAQYDLSTTSGQAQYNEFLATGQMPTTQSTGVSDIATINKIDVSSQAQLEAKVGPLSLGVDGEKTTGSVVETVRLDGTMSRTESLQYGTNVPLTINREFAASGREIISAREYNYTIEVGSNNDQILNIALTGDENKALGGGPVMAGQTVDISFSESQMRSLMHNTRNAAIGSQNGNAPLADITGYDVGTQTFHHNDVTPQDFAIDLARNRGSDDMGIAAKLFVISDNVAGPTGGGIEYAIDASVNVVN